jgi:type II secretory pathway component PulF
MEPNVEQIAGALLGGLLLGASLHIAVRIVAGSHESLRQDAICNLMYTTATLLIAVSVGIAMAMFTSVLSALVFLLAVFVVIDAAAKRRSSRQYAMLSMLGVAVERGMKLSASVGALAREYSGRFGRRAGWMAAALAEGMPFSQAVELWRGLLPFHSRPFLRIGCQTGNLAPTLRRAAQLYDYQATVLQQINSKLVYCCVVLISLIGTFAFIVRTIVPHFEILYADYGLALPPMTQVLADLGDPSSLFVPVVSLTELLLGAFLIYIVLRQTGITHWDLPGSRWAMRRLDSALVLDVLSLAVGSQMPMPEAVTVLAESYPKRYVRRRLARAAREIAQGRPWGDALTRHRLIGRADLAVLSSAERVGNLSWAMRELADSNRRRQAYRYYALMQVMYPAAMLSIAALVGFLVIALFIPLIALVQKLT